jgi:hypothetical protein
MSNINTVRPNSLHRCWKLNVFQVSPANTLVGSANERALDVPSRPWWRLVFTVRWSSRLLASRRQEVHPIDDRMDEIPILASLRKLLLMDTKFASGVADHLSYTESSSSPWCHNRYKCAEIVCTVPLSFGLLLAVTVV